ncbi:1,4-dihydroxy-2-naphthoate octaprenyltransferase [Candidatus Methanoperedens nitroreducens]|uniref:1,4-dihydroxy-2-naphthoate octaprenyltransferase n=1 Tax=Candidatus Methanoperedens nitratireducens TaxID=1392998 RepID=A0A062V7G6_9EURY|nr:1,4-dihydroxy-2-naphthoate octaprenyltransferase [Candidatus Methanoperedens nitroreducens]
MKKFLIYLKATRPEIFIMDWSMIWVAFFLVETEINTYFIITILILMLISGPFIHGAVDIINDYFDYRIDVKNKRTDKLLVTGEITASEMLYLTVALLIIGNFMALLLLPPLFAFLMILSSIIGVLYSVPPVRFREYYPLSAILPSIPYFLISPIAWYVFTGAVPDKGLLIGLILAVNMFLGLTLKDIYDYLGDLQHGVKSIVYWLNPVKARYFVILVTFVSPSLIVLGILLNVFSNFGLLVAFSQYLITLLSSKFIISGEWSPGISYKLFYPTYRLGCFILLSLLGLLKLI